MRDLPGRMFPERAAECYKNHRPNVTRISGREFPESLAECYKNGWPNLTRISTATRQIAKKTRKGYNIRPKKIRISQIRSLKKSSY